MDNFKEQLVKKTPSSKDKISKVMVLLMGLSLGALVVFIALGFFQSFVPIAFLVGLGILYGAFLLSLRFDVEYEYIFTNGEMDIDKIIAQRSRKRLVTVKITSASGFGIADDNYQVDNNKTLILASESSADCTDYYIEFNHRDLGESVLIFTPDEDMLELVENSLPRKIKNQLK